MPAVLDVTLRFSNSTEHRQNTVYYIVVLEWNGADGSPVYSQAEWRVFVDYKEAKEAFENVRDIPSTADAERSFKQLVEAYDIDDDSRDRIIEDWTPIKKKETIV